MQKLFLLALCLVAVNAFVYLREGEECNPHPVLGLPTHSECGFNLVCSGLTKTCIKPLNLFMGECERERSVAMSKGLLGTFIPKCSDDGSYHPVQCKGSVCKCVTKEGEVIDGFKGGRGMMMNCNCARDHSNYSKTGHVGQIFMCESNGSYKKVQCLGSVCFCVDTFGKQIGSSGVHISKIDSLNC